MAFPRFPNTANRANHDLYQQLRGLDLQGKPVVKKVRSHFEKATGPKPTLSLATFDSSPDLAIIGNTVADALATLAAEAAAVCPQVLAEYDKALDEADLIWMRATALYVAWQQKHAEVLRACDNKPALTKASRQSRFNRALRASSHTVRASHGRLICSACYSASTVSYTHLTLPTKRIV